MAQDARGTHRKRAEGKWVTFKISGQRQSNSGQNMVEQGAGRGRLVDDQAVPSPILCDDQQREVGRHHLECCSTPHHQSPHRVITTSTSPQYLVVTNGINAAGGATVTIAHHTANEVVQKQSRHVLHALMNHFA